MDGNVGGNGMWSVDSFARGIIILPLPRRRQDGKTYSALLAFCKGNPLVTGGFSKKDQKCGTLTFSMQLGWITNDMMRYGMLWYNITHYDYFGLF